MTMLLSLLATALIPATSVSMPASAQDEDGASELSFSYVELNYMITDSDQADDTLGGLELLGSLELPLSYPVGRWNTLLSVMRRDKKARGDLLRFVILDGVARPTILAGPDESLLFAAWQEVGG